MFITILSYHSLPMTPWGSTCLVCSLTKKKMFSTAYHDSRLVFKLIRRKLLSYGQLNINIFEYRVELNGNRSTSFFKWSKITILSALPRNKWITFATHLFIYPNIYLFKYFLSLKKILFSSLHSVSALARVESPRVRGEIWNRYISYSWI